MKHIPLAVAGAVFTAEALVEGARIVLGQPWPGFTSTSGVITGLEAALWLVAAVIAFTGARRLSDLLMIASAVSIAHGLVLLVPGNHLATLGFLAAAAVTAVSAGQRFAEEASQQRRPTSVRFREPLPVAPSIAGSPAFRAGLLSGTGVYLRLHPHAQDAACRAEPMNLRVTEHRVRLGPRDYRVVSPWPALSSTWLSDPTDFYAVLVSNRPDLARLAALFAFAARSPHTLVYLPLRHNKIADYIPFNCVNPSSVLDLLLVPSAMQLAPSGWPEVRRKLGRGRPARVHTHEAEIAQADEQTPPRPHHDDRDWLRPAVHARTLVLTGNAAAFSALVPDLAWGAAHARLSAGDYIPFCAVTKFGHWPDLYDPEIDLYCHIPAFTPAPRRAASNRR